MRAQLPPCGPDKLLCVSAQPNPLAAAAENMAWRDWSGRRLVPKSILARGSRPRPTGSASPPATRLRGPIFRVNASVVGRISRRWRGVSGLRENGLNHRLCHQNVCSHFYFSMNDSTELKARIKKMVVENCMLKIVRQKLGMTSLCSARTVWGWIDDRCNWCRPGENFGLKLFRCRSRAQTHAKPSTPLRQQFKSTIPPLNKNVPARRRKR